MGVVLTGWHAARAMVNKAGTTYLCSIRQLSFVRRLLLTCFAARFQTQLTVILHVHNRRLTKANQCGSASTFLARKCCEFDDMTEILCDGLKLPVAFLRGK
jgi:hypothetical protein